MADEENKPVEKVKGLKETLQEINEKLSKDEKEEVESKTKYWNLPLLTRFGMGKKKKRQGYVVFVHLGTNKAIQFIKAQIIEGVALVNNIPHVIEPEDIFIWKNRIPMVIQADFSERPYSAKHHYEKVHAEGTGTEGWQLIMNYLYAQIITDKKKIGYGAIIIGVIVLLGLGFYLVKSGALSK